MPTERTVIKTAENPKGRENYLTEKGHRTPDGHLHVSFGRIMIQHCATNNYNIKAQLLDISVKPAGAGCSKSARYLS